MKIIYSALLLRDVVSLSICGTAVKVIGNCGARALGMANKFAVLSAPQVASSQRAVDQVVQVRGLGADNAPEQLRHGEGHRNRQRKTRATL